MTNRAANPFSPRTVLALVLFGAVAFIALLWMMGAGMTGGSTNNGGGHAGGKGLNGFAALTQLLEKRGYQVDLARNPARLDEPGLLILTPPQTAKGSEIAKIVERRRRIGPTLVITPKWLASPMPPTGTGKQGWVALSGTAPPTWQGFLDDVTVRIAPLSKDWRRHWLGRDASGMLPQPTAVLSGSGPRLAALVSTSEGRTLAAYVQDEGFYPALEELAPLIHHATGDDDSLYPLIVVFEPDLLDNYGMARRENALLADQLIRAATSGAPRRITFDVTLNGLGRSANLLTLAFTPPYLAATLCLLLAAVAAAWRAFLRFGAPRTTGRAIAFGKRALVTNSAGLIRRTRRLHLVTRPYADRVRERIARTLGLPRQPSPEATETAIDRALALRTPGAEPFSQLAARLRAAHKPLAIVRAAQALHSLERTLTR